MACLDTTILIDLLGRHGARARASAEVRVRQLVLAGDALVTTRLNVAELYVGVELSRDPAREDAAVCALLAPLAVLEFNESAARSYGQIQAFLQRRGSPIGDLDALIAAMAIANGHPLVSANTRHFALVPGLRLVTH